MPAAPTLTTVTVDLPAAAPTSYPVVIGTGLNQQIVQFATGGSLAGHRGVIITDDTVHPLFAEPLAKNFAEAGNPVSVLRFPPGERSKTRTTKAWLEDQLIEAGFGRDTLILAVGGGVVTDLAGFVAATYTRGVPLINVPTTMLAAADASIGGKTGLDTDAATNLIGAFHQPQAVFIDLDTLSTLPAEQIRTGLAETIKHALIADAALFQLLEDAFVTQASSLTHFVKDVDLSRHVSKRNAEIKRDFVSADAHEKDLRMALNLGHTFGRALESAMGYTISHGQAVAIGLMLQARWGQQLGFVQASEVHRLETLLRAVGLPTELPKAVDRQAFLRAMQLDKKARAGTIRFVYQRGIGGYQTFNGTTPCLASDPQTRTTRPAGVEEITAFLDGLPSS